LITSKNAGEVAVDLTIAPASVGSNPTQNILLFITMNNYSSEFVEVVALGQLLGMLVRKANFFTSVIPTGS